MHRQLARMTSFAGGLVVLATACSSPLGFERDVEAPIQTERLRYQLRRVDFGVETDIEYEFTNGTSGPVFIVNCNGSTLPSLPTCSETDKIEQLEEN